MSDVERRDEPSDLNPVEILAASFIERYRRGERPEIAEYIEQHPNLAEEIRDVFPALLLVEKLAEEEVAQPAAEEAPTSHRPSEPRELGDYLIHGEVGRGGMGIVYEATQKSLGRRVALKVLPFHTLLSKSHLERFHREAQAAARLHHSAIVPVFEVGEAEGVHYYAMQFIHGQSLDQVIKELRKRRALATRTNGQQTQVASGPTAALTRSLLSGEFARSIERESEENQDPHENEPASSSPPAVKPATTSSMLSDSELSSASNHHYFRSVAGLGLQAAEALDYAHREGVLHRDIKPSNLLLDTRGTVWLTDFGLAKAVENESLTREGDVLGTLSYMAPERLQGWSDPRSDVYSLGLTLYELLTLRRAFEDSERHRLIARILDENPPRPRRLARDIPTDLETIVLKAIDKEPGKRYQTAGEMKHDLGRFLEGRPVLARRIGALERTWLWCRRNRAVATLLTAVLILSAVSSIAAFKWRSERSAANENLWTARRTQAELLRSSTRPGRKKQSIETIRLASLHRTNLELRNEAIAATALFDVARHSEWPLPEECRQGTFSPSLDRYALQILEQGNDRKNRVREISVHALPGHEPIASLPGNGEDIWLGRFSPDGRFVTYRHTSSGEVSLCVWDTVTGDVVFKTRSVSHGQADVFSPDGRLLASAQKGGTIRLINTNGFKESKSVDAGASVDAIRFDPGSDRLAVSLLNRKSIRIMDLATAQVTRELKHKGLVVGLAWHPIYDLLAVACYDEKVHLWDVSDTVEPRVTFEGHELGVRGVAFLPSGNFLVSRDAGGEMYFWDVWSRRARVKQRNTLGPTIRPDGRRVGYWNPGVASIWELLPSQVLSVFSAPVPKQSTAWRVDLTPDHRFAVTSADDGFRLWSIDKGRLELFMPLASDGRAALFTRNGRDVLTVITASGGGLHAWRLDETTTGGLAVGGSRALWSDAQVRDVQVALNGNTLAFLGAGDIHVHVMRSGRPAERVAFPGQQGHDRLAISPDGRWVATAGWKAHGLRIVDAVSGEAVSGDTHPELAGFYSPTILFTPDGRWLVASLGTEWRFFEVGKWTPSGPPVKREAVISKGGLPMAVSPDSRLLAVEDPRGVVRLLDVEKRIEVGRLQGSDHPRIRALRFSRDGTRLAATWDPHRVAVWNLGKLREELAFLQLDRYLPPSPRPRKTAPAPAESLQSPDGSHIQCLSLVPNPRFQGTAGETTGGAQGSAPDAWRVFGVGGSRVDAVAVPLEANEIFRGSPPTTAMLLRVTKFGGDHALDHEPKRFRLTPGRHYRAKFYAKCANNDGSAQKFELNFPLFRGPPHDSGRYLSREPGDSRNHPDTPWVATNEWQLYIGPKFQDKDAGNGHIAWRCLDDGGEDAILVAMPEVEELLFPTGLFCEVRGSQVRLTWTKHADYHRLRVLRDGRELMALSPDTTSAVDEGAPHGKHTYRIEATILESAGGASCEAEVAAH